MSLGPQPHAVTLLRTACVVGAVIVATHLVLVLYSGSYAFTIVGLAVASRRVTLPVMLLAILIAGAVVFGDRRPLRTAAWRHAALLLFALLLNLYLLNARTLGSGDTLPARYLPVSILREGNFDLDEFSFLFTRGGVSPDHVFMQKGDVVVPYYVEHLGRHYVSFYPVGGPLLATPIYLLSVLGGLPGSHPIFETLEKLSAAIIVALSAVVIYHALCLVTTETMALAVSLIYGLGTSSLSVSSQALWQHGPSQLALAGALYGALRSRTELRWLLVTGFCFAFAAVCRPTDALIVLPLAIYILYRDIHLAPLLLAGALPPIAFQLCFNYVYFGNPLHSIVGLGMSFWSTPLHEGLAGILLSPGRGLFVYSPVFAFSVYTLILSWHRPGDAILRSLSVGTLLTVLLYGKWVVWWGGYCYGPRLLADLAPVLAFSLYPLRDSLVGRRGVRALFVAAVALSVYAHVVGAFSNWGESYVRLDIRRHPERLWNWADNPLTNVVLRREPGPDGSPVETK